MKKLSKPAASPAPATPRAITPAPATAAAPGKGAAPVAPAGAPRPVAQRPSAPVIPALKTVDKVLIYSALVCSLVAVGVVTWVFMTLKNVVENPPT